MTVPVASPRSKAVFLYTLKEGGDIESPEGRASRVLLDRMAERGSALPNSVMSDARRSLVDEGLIEVEYNHNQTRIMSLKLLGLGEYPDPYEDSDNELFKKPNNVKRQYTPRGTSGLDRARNAIEALPVAERLMLVGEIIDAAAEELIKVDEERETKQRELRELLRGAL